MEEHTMSEINKIMLNPVRLRIVQEAAKAASLTTSEICERIHDVPRTTVYRHIALLIENEVLTVVSEKKIRGSVERILAINPVTLQNNNTMENASGTAFLFLMDKYTKFDAYFKNEQSNPGRDKIFMNNTILMMSDEEFDQFLSDLRDLLIKYSYEVSNDRRARDKSILSVPVTDEVKVK